ncbi:MAG: FMN-dependent NADH-azoreductase [Proteobacteria bacterium]|nr:FMN-dependent NADH-azoreductase [Pseudomonadota bacterium]
MKLLHIDSSIFGANSVSRKLSADIVAAETRRNPGLEVTYRDLVTDPVGHLTGEHVMGAGDRASAELERDVAAGQAALAEFLAADIVVIGAPMYNFTVPSQLKAWIDRIAAQGKTFRYTENGPVGLAGGKKVIVASSRGGYFNPQSANAALDHQESYLRGFFGFLGIDDVSVIRAEGLNMGNEIRTQAIDAAVAEIDRLAA